MVVFVVVLWWYSVGFCGGVVVVLCWVLRWFCGSCGSGLR